jgi:putative endonuclease
MSQPRQSLGQRGEALVADHLSRAGYTILARNWRFGAQGELDIVARRGTELAFVEVRTRRGPLNEAVEWALASVDDRKRARLVRLAEAYLDEHGLEGAAWRIDVVAVACQGNSLVMEVITDAVEW